MEPTQEAVSELAANATREYLKRFEKFNPDLGSVHETLAEIYVSGFVEGYQTKGAVKKIGPIQKLDMASTGKVIVVKAVMGDGSDEHPLRNAKLYFTEDGAFIGEAPDWLRPENV